MLGEGIDIINTVTVAVTRTVTVTRTVARGRAGPGRRLTSPAAGAWRDGAPSQAASVL